MKQYNFTGSVYSIMDIDGLKMEIAVLKAALKEKEEKLYRAEQKSIKADKERMLSTLQSITHSLICPFCGVTVPLPPVLGSHTTCFTTGYWAKGFRTHNDWVRACVENGATVDSFYRKARENNLIHFQENGKRPDKAEI